ncbi:MAG: endonuclease [Chitinophagales bacterium]|nr:endonuclease [Chitinophagales bacterium]
MKNILLTIIACLNVFLVFAQGTYYNDLDSNKRCQELKNELSQKLNKNVSTLSYDMVYNFMSNYDLININGKDYIWDVYTYIPSGAQQTLFFPGDKCSNDNAGSQVGKCWNREHVMPASWFSNATPMYSDFHNLLPTDAYINSKRSNMPHATTNSTKTLFPNGSIIGNSNIPLVVGDVFEPIDEFKGDIARILLYMSVRYQTQFKEWIGTDFNKVKGTDDLKGYREDYLNMLISWHNQDPPSQKEKDRNNRIFSQQGNRNPFVDFPQFVEYIWQTSNCKAVGIHNFEQLEVNLFPNPAKSQITLSSIFPTGQDYYISDIAGKTVQSGKFSQSSINISNLNNGTYFLILNENGVNMYGKFLITQ